MAHVEPTAKAGWEVKTLGEVCAKITDGSHNPPKGIDGLSDFMMLSSKNVHDDEINLDKPRYLTESDFNQEDKRTSVSTDDVLLTIVGTVGRVAVVPEEFPRITLQRSVGVLKPLESEVVSRFLMFALQSELQAILGEARGVAQKGIYLKQLRELTIPVPPLAEQERIVGILDEAFEGIAAATAQAEKNLHNARELFQSVLQSTFSQKGDDWVEKTLKEMAKEFGRGKSKHRPRNADFLYGGQYPFVQTGDIRNSDHLITKYSQTYSEEGLAQSKLWPEGTVCITIAANIAETGILNFDACFPDSVIGMIPDPEKSIGGYIEYLLQFFKVELQRQGKGSAQDNINLGTFKDQTFPFAPVNQQQAIVEKLDALSEETKALEAIYERKQSALAELKQSLLQKAFAGEL